MIADIAYWVMTSVYVGWVLLIGVYGIHVSVTDLKEKYPDSVGAIWTIALSYLGALVFGLYAILKIGIG